MGGQNGHREYRADPVGLVVTGRRPPTTLTNLLTGVSRTAAPAFSRLTRNVGPMVSRLSSDAGPAISRLSRNAGPAVSRLSGNAGPAASRLFRNAGPVASRLSGNAAPVVSRLSRAAGLNRRGVWSRPGRHHIEVRGVAQVGSELLIRRVEAALCQVPGVAWARVNAPSGRVVVAVQPPEPRLTDLIRVIAAIERSDHTCDPDAPQPHPPEEGPRTRRAVSVLTADAIGLGLSVLGRISSFTPLPGEVAGLLNAIDLHPKLHALADRGMRGDQRAETAFPLLEALAQGLTGGWAGILLDGAQRSLQWREARAQLASWCRAEPELAGTPERAAAAPPEQHRPRPKPDGPAQRYISRVLNAGAVAGAAALPLAGRKRASALALSTLAKAPMVGREAYAAHLGRIVARRGAVVLDRGVLRDLDRIDTLVVDERVLRTERGILTDLVPLAAVNRWNSAGPDGRPGPSEARSAPATPDDGGEGPDPAEIPTRVFELFDPDRPTELRQRDGWLLGPLDELPVPGPVAALAAGALSDDGEAPGGTRLGLVHDGTLVAVLRVRPESAVGADLLPAAADRAGLRLVLADTDLFASVRALQADGAMVMLVSSDPRALGAADCGLGCWSAPEIPPAGAHVLVGDDLALATLLVDAAGVARTLTRQNIRLSGAGSGLGALTALTSARSQLPGRTITMVNTAAGVALANGIWHAHRLGGQPVPVPLASPIPWHLMPVPAVLGRLQSDPEGLSTGQVRERTGGPDRVDHGLGLLRAFTEELNNPLTPVLAVGAGLSAAVGSVVDAALVGGVIGVSALIGATHRVNTERALAGLLSRSAVSARVRRDGTERVVAAEELVPGDVVLLDAGDAVPADCRIIEAVGLEADESSLSGESLPVAKTDRPVIAEAVGERRSMLYEGTTIAAGQGRAVVVATGAGTEVGRGVALARQGAPGSGVEARLTALTRRGIPLAAGAAVAVAGAGLLHGVPLRQTVATAANLAVASVPEGLPFLVSAAQLAAARRLAEHGALVRNPRTIEALGRVDVLCFDKTGTLTEGRLQLVGLGDTQRYAETRALTGRLRTVLAAALRATPAADDPEQCVQQTDRAVLLGAQAARVVASVGTTGWQPVSSLPFEPSRGFHATVGQVNGGHLLSVKGAPETILPRCGRQRTPRGERPLDAAGRQALHNLIERHAGAGHRVLAIAERPVGTGTVTEDDVRELTFVGYLTLADAVRTSAAPAVRRIRAAGVHTIMITGDHPATAAAIAELVNPDGGPQRVLTAAELDRLDDDTLAGRLTSVDVVARCTPAQKVRIIQTLQGCGRTVAMTGDGANDAPAIRLADVGIALGERGTPAARAAADLVVTDDRLETIIATLIEGRAMWSSVRHALSILVGGNLGEIAFSVLTAATTGRSALNGRQLLLVNLLTDLAPAMAIAVRPPRPDSADSLLREGPDNSLGATLNREITLRAASTTLGATGAWTLARLTGRRRRAATVALAALVGTQLGQTLLDGGASPGVLASTTVSAATLAAVIQTPGVSHFFGCTPLGPIGWGIAAGSAAGATLTGALVDRLLGDGDRTDGDRADGRPHRAVRTSAGAETPAGAATGTGTSTDAGTGISAAAGTRTRAAGTGTSATGTGTSTDTDTGTSTRLNVDDLEIGTE